MKRSFRCLLHRYNEQYVVLVTVVLEGLASNFCSPVDYLAEQSGTCQRNIVQSIGISSHDAFNSFNLLRIGSNQLVFQYRKNQQMTQMAHLNTSNALSFPLKLKQCDMVPSRFLPPKPQAGNRLSES